MLMRKWLVPVLIMFGVIVFASHSVQGGPEASIGDVLSLMKGEPRPVIVDLRSAADYHRGAIPGALSVPQAAFKAALAGLKLSKTDAVILYGAGDTEARETTRFLYENGYQGALSLKGGFAAWQAAGQAITKK